ncbi:nucleotidyltransferase family protein [Actinomyces sp. MRS3W]|uniref:nucleotidyltransferase family protein n=1 Tax=Actinomyces sp. MRS3W TaxID=2800796 RepID=UPI0028FDB351|nr:nucleotidyltransferase family protein [Actinomyces sp. MRS3W]MDU0348239.1 nucleotidyltransferase family protein [Actinomyces sp. MRS3W]
MMVTEVSDVDLERLDELCRRFGIAGLDIFGSVARGEANSSSDIDLLYQLEPGRSLGWEIEDLSNELSVLFGRPVDLVSRRSLHPLIREQVLADAKPIYAAA